MATPYTVILEDFEEELIAIRLLVQVSADPNVGRPRARVAGANAAVLLLAATFEEFVREMARAFAKATVEACPSYDKLPSKLAGVAWKRTLEGLARIELDPRTQNFSRDGVVTDALTRFNSVYEFCKGDISQNIYEDLIQNENNMRPKEINSLFRLSGLSDINRIASTYQPLLDFFNEVEPGKANGQLITRIEEFFKRRNQVAHSINAMRSSGPDQINEDISLLEAFGKALAEVLNDNMPAHPQT